MLGFTSNMTDSSTQYRNGTDLHFDWGASQFLGKSFFVGAVGYVYEQQSGDSGSGDKVGPFRSRVVGVGPQLGFIFPVSAYTQGYIKYQRLQGVGRTEPAGGLEYLAHFGADAGRAAGRERRGRAPIQPHSQGAFQSKGNA